MGFANYLLIKQGEKVRTATTIIWVDDLIAQYGEDWEARLHGYLASLHIPVAVSPIHDQDTYSEEDVQKWCKRHTDPDTGEVFTELKAPRVGDKKKPHVHIIIVLGGPQTRNDLSAIFYGLTYIPVTRWERVLKLPVLTRYLSHMDNPEKFRYKDTDIKSWGNFDLKPITIKRTDEYAKMVSLVELNNYINDNNIRYYHHLCNWAFNTGDYDLIACVTGRCSYFVGYLRDKRQEDIDRKEEQERKRKEEGITIK